MPFFKNIKLVELFKSGHKSGADANIIVCLDRGDQAICIRAKDVTSSQCVESFTVSPSLKLPEHLNNCANTCEVWSILTKGQYLSLTLDVPDASEDELRTMLSLEAGTHIPPEFGSFELSYMLISDAGQGLGRYEVYITQVSTIERHVSSLKEKGVIPSRILPSAVLWRKFIDEMALNGSPVLSLSETKGLTELVIPGKDNSLWIRTPSCEIAKNADSLASVMSESMLSGTDAGTGENSVLKKLGKCKMGDAVSSGIQVEDISSHCQERYGIGNHDIAASEPVLLAGAGLCINHKADAGIESADITPYKDKLNHRKSRILRRMCVSSLMFWAAVVVVMVGIFIANHRYCRQNSALTQEIAQIKAVGQQVDRRLLQLETIKTSKESTRLMQNIIEGLYAATPEGITYNQVSLSHDMELSLAGQALSSSQPFLLPQALQDQLVFDQVTLKDVGQKSQGDGVKTEFRLQCVVRKAASQ